MWHLPACLHPPLRGQAAAAFVRANFLFPCQQPCLVRAMLAPALHTQRAPAPLRRRCAWCACTRATRKSGSA